jgi:hypothetical protein
MTQSELAAIERSNHDAIAFVNKLLGWSCMGVLPSEENCVQAQAELNTVKGNIARLNETVVDLQTEAAGDAPQEPRPTQR